MQGGCDDPPPGTAALAPLLEAMAAYPYVMLRVLADVDVTQAHYLDAYAGRDEQGLPEGFRQRRADYAWRRKDLEVCRVLGILPNTEIPAHTAYVTLLKRLPTLDAVCLTGRTNSKVWPECPHAQPRYYETVTGGTAENGPGLAAMLRHRAAAEMAQVKQTSVARILAAPDHLYIRPQHVLCMLCVDFNGQQTPLADDNLVELLRVMKDNPDVPVTLTEGCCQVCDPCPQYHEGEHLCYHAHVKNALRDLMILERLDLAPGATLPANELYRRVYAGIENLREICGWRDGSDTADWWRPCSYDRPVLEQYRRKGAIASAPVAYAQDMC